jgi:hypothetical protein
MSGPDPAAPPAAASEKPSGDGVVHAAVRSVRSGFCGLALALLLISGLVAALHHEVLFGGAVYHMDDAADGYYPGRVAHRRALSEGAWPSWEPNAFLGWPLTADPYYGYFYPLNAVFFLGKRAAEPDAGLASGVPAGLGGSAALHAVLAGGAMFVYLRRRRRDGQPLSVGAALFGAISYALSSFFVVRIRHIIFVQVLAWLPLVLWALDGYLDGVDARSRRRSLALCGLLLGVMLLTGAHSILHFIALLLAVYGLVQLGSVLADSAPARRVSTALRLGGPLLLAVVAGLMLAGLALAPTLSAMPSTTRSLGTDYRFASSYAWPSLQYLQFLLVPDVLGTGETRQQDWFAPWNHWELAGYYQGIVAALLALPGAFLRRRGQSRRADPERLALLACLLAGILIALGDNGPLHPLLFRYFPLYGALRCPSRGLILYVIAAPILAAHAVDALFGEAEQTGSHVKRPLDEARARRRWLFGLSLCALLVMAGLALALHDSRQAASVPAKLKWLLRSRAHVSVVLSILLSLSLVRGLLGVRGPVLLGLVAALTAGDQLTVNRGYVLPQPADYPYGMERFSAVEWLLQKQAQPAPPGEVVPYRFAPDPRGPFRLLSVGQTLGMASASGYSSVQIWRYAQLLYILRHGRPYPHRRQVDDLAVAGIWNASSPIVDMLNIRYFLAGSAPSEKWQLVYSRPAGVPPHARFEPYWDAQLRVFENRQVMPRAFVAYQAQPAQDEVDEARRVAQPDFDPHRFIVLGPVPATMRNSVPTWPAPPPPVLPPPSSPGLPVQAAQVVEYSRHRVVIEADAQQAGVLVLSDAYFPGWSATVDGVPQAIYPVNLALRGVPLSAGRHRIEFRYDQGPLRRGGLLSGLGLLLLAGLWLLPGRRRLGQPAKGA